MLQWKKKQRKLTIMNGSSGSAQNELPIQLEWVTAFQMLRNDLFLRFMIGRGSNRVNVQS